MSFYSNHDPDAIGASRFGIDPKEQMAGIADGPDDWLDRDREQRLLEMEAAADADPWTPEAREAYAEWCASVEAQPIDPVAEERAYQEFLARTGA